MSESVTRRIPKAGKGDQRTLVHLAMGHISPCVVSPLSIGLLLLFHHVVFGYSLASLSLPVHSEL